jgi:hypothetical protein
VASTENCCRLMGVQYCPLLAVGMWSGPAPPGGGSKSGMFDRTDRRLSHSGIFFRGSEILELRLSAERPLASAAPSGLGQGLRNSPRGRCPSGHARRAFHCGRTVGIERSKVRDLFYEPIVGPGGAVSNSGEMRARTGRLGTRNFARNSENSFCAACCVRARQTGCGAKT